MCISLSSSPDIAFIAGVVVSSSFVVTVFLLSLVGGVIAVVIKARRRKKGKETVKSRYNEEEPLEAKVIVNTYDYVRDQPTPRPRQDENTYDYATAENIFINPASATASFNIHVYDSADYSEVVERSLAAGEESHNEEARAEVSSGGGCHEEAVKGTSGKPKDSDVKNIITKVVKPEELYAQPDKLMKKRKNTKKDTQDNTTEEVAPPCDDLYAQPDMTKKKDKRSQQHLEQESEERKLVPTAPLSYKKHKEEKQERENEADIPDEPSLHVSDEKQ